MLTSYSLLAFLGTAAAHMEMQFPPPFNSKYNPNANQGTIDYSMTAPLEASGANFPCKGYQSALGTPAGAPTASFAIGGPGNMTISGGANHGGGSCQISLSTDGAKTFTVIQSVIGGCPASGTSNLDFTIPADAPAGDHVLAWTWHNQIGNREMYMNCAPVTLTGGGGTKMKKMARAAAYSSRPGIFIANVGSAGGGCTTEEGSDVEYPEPGPDVTNDSAKALTPSCGVTQQIGSGGDVAPPAPPASSASGGAGGVFATVSTASATASASATAAAPSSTTLATSARPSVTGAATATASSAAAAPTGTSSGTAAGSNAPGSACTDEGAWACLAGGTSFQRCASGEWSAIMAMASGMECTGGTSDTMNMIALTV